MRKGIILGVHTLEQIYGGSITQYNLLNYVLYMKIPKTNKKAAKIILRCFFYLQSSNFISRIRASDPFLLVVIRKNGSFFIRRSRICDTLIPMLKRAWKRINIKKPRKKNVPPNVILDLLALNLYAESGVPAPFY